MTPDKVQERYVMTIAHEVVLINNGFDHDSPGYKFFTASVNYSGSGREVADCLSSIIADATREKDRQVEELRSNVAHERARAGELADELERARGAQP